MNQAFEEHAQQMISEAEEFFSKHKFHYDPNFPGDETILKNGKELSPKEEESLQFIWEIWKISIQAWNSRMR